MNIFKKQTFCRIGICCIIGLIAVGLAGCGKEQDFLESINVEESGASVTDAPEESSAMESAPEPGALPERTQEPEETAAPESTRKPEETAAPESTRKPEETAAPESTQKPEETAASEGTSEPVASPIVDSDKEECPALFVEGTKLVDAAGKQVQLRGVSTHGLAWFPGYVNKECFEQLKCEWGVNVVRLAMYTAEYGGYCTGGDKEALKELVKNGVEYATDAGMYVIIDWHILSDGNPNIYVEEAKAFFKEMSETYADYTNVIYEICNEPNGGTTWSQVKEYAEKVIPVVRENDEDGIILVGTPNWCQYVEDAAADPITGYDNIMYTLHFYAATHTEGLRNSMVAAMAAGLPVFVSEYGICDASGNGNIDEYQANEWVTLMDEYGVSYVAWNLSNKAETSAFFKTECSKLSGFSEEDLSASGKWTKEMLRQRAGLSGQNVWIPE